MELTAKTKIDDLLGRYPFLLDFFLKQSPKYRLLKNPVTRKTIGKVATLAQVASIGGLDTGKLISDIANEIERETGERPAVEPGEARIEPFSPESREARKEILKDIIRDLHAGVDMAVLKKRFHDLVKDVEPSEIAAMEQALIEEGMPETEVKRLCDVHVEVFKESLSAQPPPQTPPGHPVHTFMLENRAAEGLLKEIAQILDKVCDSGDEESFRQYRAELTELLDRLAAIDLHYLRKENQLFPILENYGVEGPSQVMWALHDDIRDALKTARSELQGPDATAALNTIKYAVKSISDMIYKEENILFPMAMETLTDADWQRVREGEKEIGYAWIAKPPEWTPEEVEERPAPAEAVSAGKPGIAGIPGFLELSTGALSPEQVNLILTHLPLELSFVDENDEVRYYSEIKNKIFPRSPGVIGRKVQKCHPRSSLDKVQKILDDFRSGDRDVADFWIESKGRFIYIRYIAVRAPDGAYRGTLEIVQDATGLRKLTGEKRLLDQE